MSIQNGHLILVMCIFLSFFILSSVRAEISINDPTQPVYRQGFIGGSGSDVGLPEAKEISRDIPPLVQLIYSESRKIAMFGDEFFRPGDEAVFGRIISIEKDRVMLEHDGFIEAVLLFDPELDVEDDEESNISS